ncbi:MAG: hypothetical protein J6575_04175 [Bifidobacterium sp.]|nr:hypothetical protein [Bifidobacterium sp.]
MTSENSSDNATSAPKKAVLLMAYGTPYKTEDIMDYYTNIRHGVKPPQHLYDELAGRYEAIGGTSPRSRMRPVGNERYR